MDRSLRRLIRKALVSLQHDRADGVLADYLGTDTTVFPHVVCRYGMGSEARGACT